MGPSFAGGLGPTNPAASGTQCQESWHHHRLRTSLRVGSKGNFRESRAYALALDPFRLASIAWATFVGSDFVVRNGEALGLLVFLVNIYVDVENPWRNPFGK